MLIHYVEAREHGAESCRGSTASYRRKADVYVHRVAATHPVPELEHVSRVYAELCHPFRVG